jgi:hypothetical protein
MTSTPWSSVSRAATSALHAHEVSAQLVGIDGLGWNPGELQDHQGSSGRSRGGVPTVWGGRPTIGDRPPEARAASPRSRACFRPGLGYAPKATRFSLPLDRYLRRHSHNLPPAGVTSCTRRRHLLLGTPCQSDHARAVREAWHLPPMLPRMPPCPPSCPHVAPDCTAPAR